MFSIGELLYTFDLNNMQVHLIRKETIENYSRLNAQSKIPLEDWLGKLNDADWQQPGDIKKLITPQIF